MSSRVRLSHGGVNVFAFSAAFLDEPKLRIAVKNLNNLFPLNIVFSKQLVEKLLDPDKAGDSHSYLITALTPIVPFAFGSSFDVTAIFSSSAPALARAPSIVTVSASFAFGASFVLALYS